MVEYDTDDAVFDIYEEKILEVLYNCSVTLSTNVESEDQEIRFSGGSSNKSGHDYFRLFNLI